MTHGSLFSGIGGFDYACRALGIDTLWQVEIDPYCQKVLKKNFPGVPLYADIRTTGNLCRPDIISGGFPCQPYSNSGNRKGKKDARALWPEMLRIISESQPAWVIGENVAGIVTLDLDYIIASLEDQGYEVQALIIPACSVGASHIRERVWILAHTDCQRQSEQPINKSQANRVHTYTNSKRLPEPRKHRQPFNQSANEFLETLLPFNDLAGEGSSESGICRNAYGIPKRVDRLKALGNAIVPQVAFQILKYIKQVEDNRE